MVKKFENLHESFSKLKSKKLIVLIIFVVIQNFCLLLLFWSCKGNFSFKLDFFVKALSIKKKFLRREEKKKKNINILRCVCHLLFNFSSSISFILNEIYFSKCSMFLSLKKIFKFELSLPYVFKEQFKKCLSVPIASLL